VVFVVVVVEGDEYVTLEP